MARSRNPLLDLSDLLDRTEMKKLECTASFPVLAAFPLHFVQNKSGTSEPCLVEWRAKEAISDGLSAESVRENRYSIFQVFEHKQLDVHYYITNFVFFLTVVLQFSNVYKCTLASNNRTD